MTSVRLYLGRAPEPPDLWRAARVALAIIAVGAIVSAVIAVTSCAAGTPIARIAHVEGAGSIDLEMCLQSEDGTIHTCMPFAVEFASEGVQAPTSDGTATELVQCASVRRLVLAGATFGLGLIDDLSDDRCAEVTGEQTFPWAGASTERTPD